MHDVSRISLIIILVIILYLMIILDKMIKSKPEINEFSYQRFAKFFGNIQLKDKNFKKKIETIKN